MTNNEKPKAAWEEITSYFACCWGDCNHNRQIECYNALAEHAWNACREEMQREIDENDASRIYQIGVIHKQDDTIRQLQSKLTKRDAVIAKLKETLFSIAEPSINDRLASRSQPENVIMQNMAKQALASIAEIERSDG